MTRPEAGPSGLPAGAVVVIAGPDGAGKSSLAGALEAAAGGRVLWLHHRPRLLPSRRGGLDEPVTDPYGETPYPVAVSALKVVYYWLDYLLGWLLRVRPALRAGGAAVIERGWWDLAADPRRYRMRDVEGLVRILGSLLPRPTRTFVLTAETDLLLERTGDNLTADDLGAQMAAQRRVFAGRRGVVVLDARKSVTSLRDEVLAALHGQTARPGWAGVPRPSRARWLLPRQPRRVAAGALRIHRPMTTTADAVWRMATAGALLGAARLLPAADPASVPDLDRVAAWIPPGGGVSVARSTHARRHHALVVDARGRPVVHVKLAGDAAGQSALACEADNLQRFGTLLSGPVTAPRLVHSEPGLLVTEAVTWKPSRAVERLEPSLANQLGRLFRDTAQQGRGLAHGDFAPWNLLPTAAGWVLVDWEMVIPEAPPFFDVLHWVVMGHAHLGRPDLAAVAAGLDGKGWIGDCLRAYADGAVLPASGLRGRLGDYLDETADRVDATSAPGGREAAVRRALRRLAG